MPNNEDTVNHFSNDEILDPVNRHTLRQNLMKGLGEPFNGDPQHFFAWKSMISRRLLEAEASALDSLYILQENCTGRPKKIIKDAIAAGVHQPMETLGKVWSVLSRRFGDNILISEALLEKLKEFPQIKNANNVAEMEDLLSLCNVIEANMNHCSELGIMKLQSGMQMIYSKMPHVFETRWVHECHLVKNRTGSLPTFSMLMKYLEDFIIERSIPVYKNNEVRVSDASQSNNDASLLWKKTRAPS